MFISILLMWSHIFFISHLVLSHSFQICYFLLSTTSTSSHSRFCSSCCLPSQFTIHFILWDLSFFSYFVSYSSIFFHYLFSVPPETLNILLTTFFDLDYHHLHCRVHSHSSHTISHFFKFLLPFSHSSKIYYYLLPVSPEFFHSLFSILFLHLLSNYLIICSQFYFDLPHMAP